MNIRFSGIIVAAMLVVPNISAGAELSMFERVLVPIAVRETPGAGGSLWTSTFTVLHSTAPVSVLGYDTGGDPIGLSIGSAYRPPLYYSGTAQPAGVLVYVSRDAGPATSYALRVRDVNHDDSDGGTTIPVIREQELLTRKAYLLGVPTDARYRRMLRIYSPFAIHPTRFTVTVADERSGSIVGSAIIELLLDPATASAGALAFQLRPAERDVDLDRVFGFLPGESITVSVAPQDPTERFWTFLSVTNNVTQHVTVYLP